MYRLTVLSTEELLKMINDYFTDTAINVDNYSYDELITSCIAMNLNICSLIRMEHFIAIYICKVQCS